MKENTKQIRTQLINDIGTGSIVESYTPSSTQGIQLRKKLVSLVNEQMLTNVSSIMSVIQHSNALKHVDNQAFILSESLTEKLQSSIKYHVLFVLESLESMPQNSLVGQAKNVVESLLVMESDDLIKNSIRSGVLLPYKSIQIVESLVTASKISDDNITETGDILAHTPVSYIEKIDEHLYIRIGNNILAVNENNVINTKSPNSKFSYLSTIVESLSWNHTNESFSVMHKDFGTFFISEQSITRKTNNDQIVEHSSNLAEEFSVLIESLSENNKQYVQQSRNFIDSIITLHENYENLAILDNCVVVENKKHNEKFALFVQENASYFMVLNSRRFPVTIDKCETIHEGLEKLQKRSGYDASKRFSNAIQISENATKAIMENVEAYESIIETLTEKKNEIVGLITEEKMQQKPNMKYIGSLQQTKAKVEALIIEQRNAQQKAALS